MKIALFLLLALCGSTAFSQIQTVNIYFDKLSSVIRPEGITELENISKLLKADSTTIQSISVYTDTLGTVELNARLAQERYLNSLNVLGIKTNDVTFETNIYGEEFPFVESEYQIELFRRVTIVHFVKEEELIEEIIEEVIEEIVEEVIIEEEVKEPPSKLITQLEEFIKDSNTDEILLELSILFVGDKDIIMKESETELNQLYNFLKKNSRLTAQIRGHVCCKANTKLSKARAERVYDYLVQNSISAHRLSYKGFSNKMPKVTPELSDADRQANRRVDVVFKK